MTSRNPLPAISLSAESHLNFYRRWGKLAKPYFAWQLEQFKPYLGSRIADIGCGIGNFADLFHDKELYLGFEPDEELAGEFRRTHALNAVQLADHGDICTGEAVADMRNHHIDTVLCVNVLEHIDDDALALRHMVEGVKIGGHICIIVPAFRSLYGTLDALDGHRRRYEKKRLRALVREMPVTVVASYYMNLPGALGWFIKGKILREKMQMDENFTITNRLLPVIARIERFIKPPFGMSLVMVARRS